MKNPVGRPLSGFEVLCKEAIGTALAQYGFELAEMNVKEDFASCVFRLDEKYVVISATQHWREIADYGSAFCEVKLGMGTAALPDCDWNSIALWHLIPDNEKSAEPGKWAYYYSDEDSLRVALSEIRDDLLKWGAGFLSGDISGFRKIRSEKARQREAYKVYSKGKGGKWIMHYEPRSAKLKKKFENEAPND